MIILYDDDNDDDEDGRTIIKTKVFSQSSVS